MYLLNFTFYIPKKEKKKKPLKKTDLIKTDVTRKKLDTVKVPCLWRGLGVVPVKLWMMKIMASKKLKLRRREQT